MGYLGVFEMAKLHQKNTFLQHITSLEWQPEAQVFNKAMSSTMSAVSYLQSKVPWQLFVERT